MVNRSDPYLTDVSRLLSNIERLEKRYRNLQPAEEMHAGATSGVVERGKVEEGGKQSVFE